ncbi:hypothetical protein [Acinetobacter calcoaceticus]|uniref:hypothetical protein n=1 Tax=Acinetobacter calcoaceticus TaxID=471 RepID=UPI001D17AD65|nr:hypothetical protein [Acinetobacter calcoaceticus]
MVSCSQAVKLDEDHHHLVDYLNKEIFIPVMLSSIGSNIFYRTTVMVRQQQEDM